MTLHTFKKWILLFAIVLCSSFLFAEDTEDTSLSSVWDKPYSFHAGVGYSASLLNLDFDGFGKILGVDAVVNDEDEEQNGGVALSLSLEYNLPRAPKYFSLGVTLDYFFQPVDELDFNADSGAVVINLVDEDIANVHVFTLAPYAEIRVPIHIQEQTYLAPYLQVGAGLAINFSDEDDFEVDNAGFMLFAGGGLELAVNESVSIFLEARYHFETTEVNFEPVAGADFEADIDLSDVSLTGGVNIYFGS